MAAELKELTGAEATLIRESDGIFDVVVDGRKIFSKHEQGRFPEPGEIAGKLES